ncbi:hypothetical protein DL240_01925 [Lujinxingia litoralis]|uniref:Uncharacterized protein n=1 Tax=Lujinxingia litoralis TaxID=2211119 RepID=A0A328CDX7_9DELT|nr:hypothetical protein [Lujinxingia litoralis]RAL24993.1 hypothetical protein DL240_01925 [Lujinxingia litoralis]
MNTTMRWATMLTLGLMLVGGGAAVAQQSDEGERLLTDFNDRNGGGVIDEDLDALTPAQMSDRAANKIDAMRVTLESTTQLLDNARDEERDILKINCINEKLASIRGFVKVSEQSYVSLTDSVSANDGAASRHHYTLVSIAGQRVSGLGEEARVCAGEELRYADDAVLEVSVDPGIGSPDEDFLADEREVLDRLPELTPYQ